MLFNLNESVRVQLTGRGRQIHRRRFEQLREAFPRMDLPYTPPKEDAGGWSEWQLWVLMETFGEHVSIGADPPFETTIDIPPNQPSAFPESATLLARAVLEGNADAAVGLVDAVREGLGL